MFLLLIADCSMCYINQSYINFPSLALPLVFGHRGQKYLDTNLNSGLYSVNLPCVYNIILHTY